MTTALYGIKPCGALPHMSSSMSEAQGSRTPSTVENPPLPSPPSKPQGHSPTPYLCPGLVTSSQTPGGPHLQGNTAMRVGSKS